MRQVGVSGLDLAPNGAQLVRVQLEAQAHAGQGQVRTVESPGGDVVVSAVVDLDQFGGPVCIRPDPRLELVLDLADHLVGGRSRRGVGHFLPFPARVQRGSLDRHATAVQGRLQQLGCGAFGRAVFGTGTALAAQVAAFHLPRFGDGVEGHGPGFDFPGEGVDVLHGNPRRTQLHADLRRPELFRLHRSQRLHVALVAVVGVRSGPRLFQLRHDIPGQVLVGQLPSPARGLEHLIAQRLDGVIARNVEALCHIVEVQRSDLVQRHRQRVADRLDLALYRLLDRAPQQERRLDDVTRLVDLFQAADDGAVVVLAQQAVVLEDADGRLDDVSILVRALAHLDAEVLDRAVFGAECVVGIVEALERGFPVAIVELGGARLLHQIAQTKVAGEPFGVLVGQLHGVAQRLADTIRHSHQRPIRGAVHHTFAPHLGIEVHLGRLGAHLLDGACQRGVGIARQALHRLGELGVQFLGRLVVGHNGVFLATEAIGIDPAPLVVLVSADAVLTQHHSRVGGEVFVDDDGSVLGVDRGHPVPRVPGRGLAGKALAQEQDVGHHAGAGVALERGGRKADRPQQVSLLRQVGAGLIALLVHRALAGHEHQQAARAHAVQRLGEEEVMQHESVLGVVGIAQHLGRGKRRIADRHIEEVTRQLALDEVVVQQVLLR